MSKIQYTLITGASKGLGQAFAMVCAQMGRNLIITSLPGEDLEEVAKSIAKTYNVKVLFFEKDLTNTSERNELIMALSPFEVNMLINNAGLGGVAGFQDTGFEKIEKIMLLNMISLVFLTHKLLPVLKRQEEAYILNISSLAAFCPIPFKVVYAASKGFVYSFSLGLKDELKGTNIHLAVAHPGGMATNGESIKGIKSLNGFLKRSILTPSQTAELCMEKMLQKHTVIIPGKINWLGSLLQKVIPKNLQMKIYRKKLAKLQNQPV